MSKTSRIMITVKAAWVGPADETMATARVATVTAEVPWEQDQATLEGYVRQMARGALEALTQEATEATMVTSPSPKGN